MNVYWELCIVLDGEDFDLVRYVDLQRGGVECGTSMRDFMVDCLGQ